MDRRISTNDDTNSVDVSVTLIAKHEQNLLETVRRLEKEIGELKKKGISSELVVVVASTYASFPEDLKWVKVLEIPRIFWGENTIAKQRNLAARESKGKVLVFTDVGVFPQRKWLFSLVAPILDSSVLATTGLVSAKQGEIFKRINHSKIDGDSVENVPTCNAAIQRDLFIKAGLFDEKFKYGSDIDLSWRLSEMGFPFTFKAGADIEIDWGTNRRQVSRAINYGEARARLFVKHWPRSIYFFRKSLELFAYPTVLLFAFLGAIVPGSFSIFFLSATLGGMGAIIANRFFRKESISTIWFNALLSTVFVWNIFLLAFPFQVLNRRKNKY